MGSTFSRLQNHYEEAIYFLPLCSQKSLVLIWSTWEGWKAVSTLEPCSGFEQGTPRLGSSALMTRSLLHKTYSAGSCYNEPFYLILLFLLGYPTRLKQLFLIQQQIPTNTFQLFPAWDLSFSISKHIINNLNSVGSCFPFQLHIMF